MVGVPRMFTILQKTSTLSFHSVESSKSPDTWSAIKLIFPGMWLIESHMFLEMHHSHICLAMSLHGGERGGGRGASENLPCWEHMPQR